MAKKKTANRVVKRVVKRVRVAPVVAEIKSVKRVRMPSTTDVVTDVKAEKRTILRGVPRAIVEPGAKVARTTRRTRAA